MWLWGVIFRTLWLRFYPEHIGQCGFDPNVDSVAVGFYPYIEQCGWSFFLFIFYRRLCWT